MPFSNVAQLIEVGYLLFYHFLRHLVHTVCRIYFRIEFHDVERVPIRGPVILAPNHASFLDPVWVSIPIGRRLRYMTWDKMFRVPLLGPLMRVFGAFPVKVEIGDRGAIRHSVEHLRAGGALMIFPEGGRTRNGQLMGFKPGVIQLALTTGAPIVPVTIIGGYRVYSPWHKFPRPLKLRLYYHEPIALTPPEDEAQMKAYLKEQAERLRSIVATRLPDAGVQLEAAHDEAR
ncbi:MAG: lysophospholipid acyltransferase family protein [Acidobacteriota bacterium]